MHGSCIKWSGRKKTLSPILQLREFKQETVKRLILENIYRKEEDEDEIELEEERGWFP